ncbi:hypothetical protein OKW42_004841 [Paraburkholderia sp. WC7.3d]
MTSSFTRTCASIILPCLATVSYALPLAAYGPDKPVNDLHRGPAGWAISMKCKHNGASDDCVVSALKNGKPTQTIIKTSVRPGIQWYGDIAMMRFPCGTGCRNDMFFSPPNKVDGHELVAQDAIDIKRRLVVSVASNPLEVFRLFAGKAPVATLHLATSYTRPDVERLRWERDRLDVWYRDDSGALKRASVAIPRN